MTDSASEQDDLEKLLADVRRTIRDNAQFISHLKVESDDTSQEEGAEEAEGDTTFEEL